MVHEGEVHEKEPIELSTIGDFFIVAKVAGYEFTCPYSDDPRVRELQEALLGDVGDAMLAGGHAAAYREGFIFLREGENVRAFPAVDLNRLGFDGALVED